MRTRACIVCFLECCEQGGIFHNWRDVPKYSHPKINPGWVGGPLVLIKSSLVWTFRETGWQLDFLVSSLQTNIAMWSDEMSYFPALIPRCRSLQLEMQQRHPLHWGPNRMVCHLLFYFRLVREASYWQISPPGGCHPNQRSRGGGRLSQLVCLPFFVVFDFGPTCIFCGFLRLSLCPMLFFSPLIYRFWGTIAHFTVTKVVF